MFALLTPIISPTRLIDWLIDWWLYFIVSYFYCIVIRCPLLWGFSESKKQRETKPQVYFIKLSVLYPKAVLWKVFLSKGTKLWPTSPLTTAVLHAIVQAVLKGDKTFMSKGVGEGGGTESTVKKGRSGEIVCSSSGCKKAMTSIPTNLLHNPFSCSTASTKYYVIHLTVHYLTYVT